VKLELGHEEVTSFDHEFKYLWTNFMRSMVMRTFEKQMGKRKILSYPGTFDIEGYLQKRDGV